jgi:glycosyltransferase involved in cell wall biosynthesis
LKVLLINSLYTPNVIGGAERSVQFLAEALADEGHDVVVACLERQGGITRDIVNGVPVYYLGLDNVYWPFGYDRHHSIGKLLWHARDTYNRGMAERVGDILATETPEVVHTNNLAGFSVAIWHKVKEQGIPLVHTLRDYYLLCPRTSMFRREKNCTVQCRDCRIYSELRRGLSNAPDAVVAISKFILRRHTDLGYFRQVKYKRVIYNPHSPQLVPETPAARTNSPLKLGYVGRLDPTKGLEVVLKALEQLPPARFELLIAGKGRRKYEQYLKAQYPLSNVQYMGFINTDEIYKDIDVLIVPALWNEPMGRTVIEAYSYGIPVVGADRGGIPELIVDGKTGFKFNPESTQELVSILKSLDDNRGELTVMREHCLLAARDYDPATILGQYLDVYQAALDHG